MTVNSTRDLPTLTLPQMLRRHAEKNPDGVALRQKEHGIWRPISWKEYYDGARWFGLGLTDLCIRPGAHVGIISENRCEWVIGQLGIGIANAITVGVYPTSPASEVAYVLEHADVEVIVCEDQEQTDKILEVKNQLPRLKKIIVMDMKGMRHYDNPDILAFETVTGMGAEADKNNPRAADTLHKAQTLEDIALIVYTSGSTGKPKGAMISYKNIRAEAPGAIERMALRSSDTALSYLPLCHVAEQVLTTFVPIYLGSRVDFGESLRTIQSDLREVAPTMFLGVPRIWEKLHSAVHIKIMETGKLRQWLFKKGVSTCEPFGNKTPHQRGMYEKAVFFFWYWILFRALQNFTGLRCCRVAITGAAPISPHITRFFRTIGVQMIEIYGLTETTGMATGPHLDKPGIGTVGAPIVGVECKTGDYGELLIRGDIVFEGYYKDPETTAQTVVDGWLRTGDVVEIGEDGYIRIVDRLKDIMITAGGKNLSPSEIENTVKASPYIKECIVIAERRQFVSALIQIDMDTVAKWAEEKNIAYTHFRSLSEHPAVRTLVEDEVAAANQQMAQVARIKKFHLFTKELDHDDDEVTATMKIRRKNIYKKYAKQIEMLYQTN